MNRGVLYALGAYSLWGLLPIYWKLLDQVPVFQLLGHRVVWSFVFLALTLLLTGQWTSLKKTIRQPRTVLVYTLSSLLIGVNWFIYVWAVHEGFIIETSLGYFINPLLSVLTGVIFLRERLRAGQWLALAIAAGGVLYLTFAYGSLPWIALSLALSWSVYALVKKLAPLTSLQGLTLETAALLLPAIAYLIWSEVEGRGILFHYSLGSDILLIATGLVTSLPLFLFALAVIRIPLSLIGVLQYLSPTLQFLIGLLIYHEPFDSSRFVGFALIWTALLVFALEGFMALKRRSTLRTS